jgi:hypothetical protein
MQARSTPSARASATYSYIGLHYGPVLIEDDDVFGDTVNAAAYLTAVAAGPDSHDRGDERNLSPGARHRAPGVQGGARGSTEESTVTRSLAQRHLNLTDVNMRSHKIIPGDQGSLIVAHHNLSLRLDQAVPTLRSAAARTAIWSCTKLASRKHVSIRLMRTHFTCGCSLNGTFVSLKRRRSARAAQNCCDGTGALTLGRSARRRGGHHLVYPRPPFDVSLAVTARARRNIARASASCLTTSWPVRDLSRFSGVSLPRGVAAINVYISAAPSNMRGVMPAASKVLAISSISGTQRYALGGITGNAPTTQL